MKQLELISRYLEKLPAPLRKQNASLRHYFALCLKCLLWPKELDRSVLAISPTRRILLLQLIPVSLRQIPKQAEKHLVHTFNMAIFRISLRRSGAIGWLNLESHLH